MRVRTNCSLFESLNLHFKCPKRQALSYLGYDFTQDDVLNEIYRVKSFLDSKGIKKGDIVSIMLPNIPAFVFSFYGISASGAVISLIPTYTSVLQLKTRLLKTKSKVIFVWDFLYNDVKDMLQELKVDAVVCDMRDYADEKYRQTIEKKFNINTDSAMQYRDLPALKDDGERTYIKMNGKEPAVHISTSGTTGGFPKIVVVSAYKINVRLFRHYNNILRKRFKLDGYKTALVDLQFACGFVFAYGMHLLLCYEKLIILPPELPSIKLTMLTENSVDCYFTHQNIIAKTIEYNKNACRNAFKNLKFLNLNLISTINTLRKEVMELLPKTCVYADSYGLTELCCVVYQRYNDEIGYTIFEGKHIIKDTNSNKILPLFEKGELLVASPYLMDGYFDDKDAEKDAFITAGGEKFLRTGDIGYLDEQDRFYYADRLKRIDKIGGFSVFPAEVEAVIKTIPGITDCVVARKKDENDKHFLAAYLQTSKDADFEHIVAEIKKIIPVRLNKFHLPMKFIPIEEIVKTPMGKSHFTYYENLDD